MKRLLPLAGVLALIASACSNNVPQGTVSFGTGQQFVVNVADSLDDVGLGNSLIVDADGNPSISYFGFPADLDPSEIPVSRPVGTPFVPAVLVTSEADGVWTRGAVAVAETPPTVIPYNPATVKELNDESAAASNGTDMVIGGDGTLHVVWVDGAGLWYAESNATATTVKRLAKLDPAVKTAGPMGWPSIAVDSDGTPWVAYGLTTGTGQEIRVATNSGDAWKTTVVAKASPCAGCAQPARTQVVASSSGPVVLYADHGTKSVVAAQPAGATWSKTTIESDVTGDGLSAAVDKDGNVMATYYSGKGTVRLATSGASGWSVVDAGEVGEASEPNPAGVGTGVAVDETGNIYVAWYDAGEDDVKLVSSEDGSTFTPVDTSGTAHGSYPSVAVSPDGKRVFLTWYGTKDGDLLLGSIQEVNDLLIAQPSPTPDWTVIPNSEATQGCGDDGKVQLSEVAKGLAFENQCLVADAGKAFSIDFDNEDAGVQHNIAVFPSATQLTTPLFTGDLLTGVAKTTYDVKSLDAGEYYFHCDVHPDMSGTLAVISGK